MEGIDAILRDPVTGQRLYPKTYEWNIIDRYGNKLSDKLAGLVAANGKIKTNDLLEGKLQLGKWDQQTGQLVADNTYISSEDFLPVLPATQIFISFIDEFALRRESANHYITFYNENKEIIGSHNSLDNVIAPDNVAYFKFNIAHSQIVTLDVINELQVSSLGRTLYEKDLDYLITRDQLEDYFINNIPDVSDQINTHNSDETAHPFIQQKIDKAVADLINSAPGTLDTLGEIAQAFEDNKDIIDKLDEAVTNKVDKIDATGADNAKLYMASIDGSQTSIEVSKNVVASTVVKRAENGEIIVRDNPTAANEAVSKKFVEDSIRNNTPDVSSQIEAHNVATTAHNDIRTEIETVRSEIPDVDDFLKYIEGEAGEGDIDPTREYYTKSETYSAEEIDAKLEESGKIKSITVNGEATEIIDGNVDIPAPQDYDLIIRTQEEFEAFYTSLDNNTNTYKNILLDGSSTFKFTRSDGKGITLGREVVSFHGINSARIEIENLFDVNTGAHAAGIRYIDSVNNLDISSSRSFKDISVSIFSSTRVDHVMGFYGMSNISNCNCYIEAARPTYFSYCYNLNNCTLEHYDDQVARVLLSFTGFSNCNTLKNCSGIFIGGARDLSSIFNSCENLSNCSATLYEISGDHQDSEIYFACYDYCRLIEGCSGECMTLNSIATAFNGCDTIMNCMGGAGGVLAAIAFNECVSIVNVQVVAVDIMETGEAQIADFNRCSSIEGALSLYEGPIFIECSNVGATLDSLKNVSGYDLIIDTQDKFDEFVQACNNQECTATSVLIKGFNDGDTVYHLNDSYILLPNTLKKIHGQDNPIIFAEYTKEQLDIMFIFAYLEELENYSEYSLENLTVNVYGFYKPSELFFNLGNVRNIDIYSFGRPCDSFFRCKNIENVNIHHDINDTEHELFSIDINEFQHCDNINNINMLVDNRSDKEGVFYAFVDCKNIGFHTLSGYTSALRPEDHLGVNKNILATQEYVDSYTGQLKLLTSPVRIYSLEDGVYKLPAGCTVQYMGTTSNNAFYLPQDTAGILTITTSKVQDNNAIWGAKFFEIKSSTYKSGVYVVYRGYTMPSNGKYQKTLESFSVNGRELTYMTSPASNNDISNTTMRFLFGGAQFDNVAYQQYGAYMIGGTLYSNSKQVATVDDVSNFITKEVDDLSYYTPSSKLATKLTAVVNTENYELTISLKDESDQLISSDTIDLPLESMVVDVDYLTDSKEIQLTLQNGNTTSFSVADLVSGLATTSELNEVKNSLANYLPLAGGKMTGKLSWEGLEALPQDTNPRHFLTIDAFSEGGVTKYVDIKDLKTALEVPTDYAPSSHSHDYLPITGGTVKNSGFGNQLTIERSDTGPTAIWFKTNETSYGYIGITESKPAFWNSDHSAFEYLSLASHTHSQYAASDHTHSTYITQSQMETYVQEQIAAAITAALEAEY